jgi:hypothetical protein
MASSVQDVASIWSMDLKNFLYNISNYKSLKQSKIVLGNCNASKTLNSIFSPFTFILTVPFFTQILVSVVLIKGLHKITSKGNDIRGSSISKIVKSTSTIDLSTFTKTSSKIHLSLLMLLSANCKVIEVGWSDVSLKEYSQAHESFAI